MIRATTILLAVVTLLILFVLYLFSSLVFLQPKGFSPTTFEPAYLRNSLLAVFTLIGILSQHIYAELAKAESEKVNIMALLGKMVRSKTMWISIIVCPVVLVSVFKSVEQLPDNTLAYLFAYQNGFFFKSILERGK